MRVYLHGSPGRPPGENHFMYVTPGNHINGKELPESWFDGNQKAISFEVKFEHGTAVVDDELGRYMIAQGLAQKSRLVLPGFFGPGS